MSKYLWKKYETVKEPKYNNPKNCEKIGRQDIPYRNKLRAAMMVSCCCMRSVSAPLGSENIFPNHDFMLGPMNEWASRSALKRSLKALNSLNK